VNHDGSGPDCTTSLPGRSSSCLSRIALGPLQPHTRFDEEHDLGSAEKDSSRILGFDPFSTDINVLGETAHAWKRCCSSESEMGS
jgi:hypothetical protein